MIKSGGLSKFMSVYCDSVTFRDIYGISLDEMIKEACDSLTAFFYPDLAGETPAA